MFLCKGLCVCVCVFGSLDSWFWGRQAGYMEEMLEIVGGGGYVRVVYMH